MIIEIKVKNDSKNLQAIEVFDRSIDHLINDFNCVEKKLAALKYMESIIFCKLQSLEKNLVT